MKEKKEKEEKAKGLYKVSDDYDDRYIIATSMESVLKKWSKFKGEDIEPLSITWVANDNDVIIK